MCISRGDGVNDCWTDEYGYADTAVHAPHGCGLVLHRDVLQNRFLQLNPHFTGEIRSRANPDGDAELHGVDYSQFEVPECPSCGGVLKPAVVFFGENVAQAVRAQAEHAVAHADGLLVVGTSLATQSAHRIVSHALAAHKPVVLLNEGPTRADDRVEVRLGVPAAETLRGAVDLVYSSGI